MEGAAAPPSKPARSSCSKGGSCTNELPAGHWGQDKWSKVAKAGRRKRENERLRWAAQAEALRRVPPHQSPGVERARTSTRSLSRLSMATAGSGAACSPQPMTEEWEGEQQAAQTWEQPEEKRSAGGAEAAESAVGGWASPTAALTLPRITASCSVVTYWAERERR